MNGDDYGDDDLNKAKGVDSTQDSVLDTSIETSFFCGFTDQSILDSERRLDSHNTYEQEQTQIHTLTETNSCPVNYNSFNKNPLKNMD